MTHGRLRREAASAKLLAGVAAFLTLFALAIPAPAQSLEDWLQGKYMTGDWGGLRTKLENEGFHLRAHYLSDTAGNPSGGLQQGTQYAQQIDFGADVPAPHAWPCVVSSHIAAHVEESANDDGPAPHSIEAFPEEAPTALSPTAATVPVEAV